MAASEQKSRFLSHMSHEIRTPLNAILGLNELIMHETEKSIIKKYSGDFQSAGRTLLALINDILDFSKIETGKYRRHDSRHALRRRGTHQADHTESDDQYGQMQFERLDQLRSRNIEGTGLGL